MSLPALNFLIKKILTGIDIFFPIFLSSMALLILLSAATWTRIISANLWDLLKIHASKFLWDRDYIWIILYGVINVKTTYILNMV